MRPRIGLVHAGGSGVMEESNIALRMLAAAGARVTYIAVNEAGTEFPGTLHHWGSLHPDKFPQWEGKRRRNGLPGGYVRWSICEGHYVDRVIRETWHGTIRKWKDGSSGLHAVDIGLHGLGLDGVIGCGVPLDGRVNEFKGEAWRQHQRFRAAWEHETVHRVLRERFRSMSGWTRVTFGEPDREWIEGLSKMGRVA